MVQPDSESIPWIKHQQPLGGEHLPQECREKELTSFIEGTLEGSKQPRPGHQNLEI